MPTHAQELLILPDRFVNAELSNNLHAGLRNLIHDYLDNISKYISDGLAPALFGGPGIGKTFTAAAAARLLVAKGIPVYWAPTVQEFNKLLDLRDYKAKSYFSKKQLLLDTKIVVFDDFGQLRDYPRIRELFFEVIDYRYSWKLSTIFTANFRLNNDADWDKEITPCFSPALTRRIKLMSKGLAFSA